MNPNQNTARGNNKELPLSETESLSIVISFSPIRSIMNMLLIPFLKTVHIRVLNESLYSVVFLLIELIV